MTKGLNLDWELSDYGWARCRVDDGSADLCMAVGYLTDALADLLYGVIALYGPVKTPRFSFEGEPVEYRWVLLPEGEAVEISIYRFGDAAESFDLPDSAGLLLWKSRQPKSRLTHAAITAAAGVLRDHGEEGYQSKWVRHPFPVNALRDLQRLHLLHDECPEVH
ncbi:hypothetical protein ACQP1K_03730 [Sphaerimonospora sp. CA-214678]|uniref:hypothetical protein n=1 Tax=Sphaerimonospora sp. CA-214678 TaxID=3240029 RepID=UPI003D8F6C7B